MSLPANTGAMSDEASLFPPNVDPENVEGIDMTVRLKDGEPLVQTLSFEQFAELIQEQIENPEMGLTSRAKAGEVS